MHTTIFVNPSLIQKLDYIAKIDYIKNGVERSRAEKVNEAIDDYVGRWEKKNGQVPEKDN